MAISNLIAPSKAPSLLRLSSPLQLVWRGVGVRSYDITFTQNYQTANLKFAQSPYFTTKNQHKEASA